MRVARLRVPAALVVAVLGCNGDNPSSDARVVVTDAMPYGDGNCEAACFPIMVSAGLCPDPLVCTNEQRMCPAGCMCTRYCFPRTAEGEMNCPVGEDRPQCAYPDATCPPGCDPVS